jgi:signal transduction histidine kinase
MDWELTVLHWNRAAERVTKIKAQEAIGKKIYEVLPEMMSVDVTPYFEALQKKKPARFMMKTVSRETGHPALFEVSSYPSESGVIIIVEDKTLEEETKRLLTIGQTAGMVGHDIRNPLQSIVSSMYLIKTDLDSLADSPEKINALQEFDSIFDQISYVDKIVSDLQDFARPIRPELREVDAKTLVASTLAALNVPSNIEVKYSDESLPRLKTDPVLLKRILLNLATNAIQAMPNGGKLTIRLRREKKAQGITLVVTDTGGGIPKDVQGKLFTPLFTTKSKGQGFGLAVVKRLVEAQGGAISFRTQAGKGTTFTVKLPSQKYTTYKLIQSSQTPI